MELITMELPAITNMYSKIKACFSVFTGQQSMSHSYKTPPVHPDPVFSPQDTGNSFSHSKEGKLSFYAHFIRITDKKIFKLILQCI